MIGHQLENGDLDPKKSLLDPRGHPLTFVMVISLVKREFSCIRSQIIHLNDASPMIGFTIQKIWS